MNIRLLFLILFVSLVGSVRAANVGYCAGEATKSGTFSVAGNTDVSGAIFLTPSLLVDSRTKCNK